MQRKQVTIVPSSMQQDIAPNQYPANAAFEVKNMRFVTIDENSTTLCISNEKGNVEVELSEPIQGTILGYEDFKDFIIIFSTNRVEIEGVIHKTDYIYKLTSNAEGFDVSVLYSGKLNFSETSPIESVKVIENDSVQKVYWVDGINSPRVINVADGVEYNEDNTQFNFFPNLSFENSSFEITKKDDYSGLFTAGVVQYAIIYFNRNGASTPVVDASSLYYISEDNRGLAPNDKVSCCFEINVVNPNVDLFKFARVYRIFRTSLDGAPEVTALPYMKFTDNNSSSIVDDGIIGASVSPTELIFLKIFDIIPNTLAIKDNTLFLGNYKDVEYEDFENAKNYITGGVGETPNTTCEYFYSSSNTSDNDWELLYPYKYKSYLDESRNKFTFFQKDETYRFGVQLLNNKGVWSKIIYIGDYINTLRVKPKFSEEGFESRPLFKINIRNGEILKNYVAIRPVCVYPTELERTVVCQGLVAPTVYNISDRIDNSPYVQSSWFARPRFISDSGFKNLYYVNPDTLIPSNEDPTVVSPMYINRNHNFGFPLEYRMNDDSNIIGLPDASRFNSEVQHSKEDEYLVWNCSKSLDKNDRLNMVKNYNFNFGVDNSIVTLHSPEMDDNYSTAFSNIPLDDVKFRIVGFVPVKNTMSHLDLNAENIFNPTNDFGFNFTDPNKKTRILEEGSTREINSSGLSVNTFPFWVDTTYISDHTISTGDGNNHIRFHASFPVYPWHRGGSLNNEGKRDNRHSTLKNKILSNLRIGMPTRYLSSEEANHVSNFEIGDIKYFNSNVVSALKLNLWDKELIYYGNVERVLSPSAESKFPIYMGAYAASTFIEGFTGGDSATIKDTVSLVRNGAEDSNGNRYQKYINYSETTYNGNSIASTFNDFSEIDQYSKDSIEIAYKSTPHIVLGFNKLDDKFVTLPAIDCHESLNEGNQNNITLAANQESYAIASIKFARLDDSRPFYKGRYGREVAQTTSGLGLSSFTGNNGSQFPIQFTIQSYIGNIRKVTLHCKRVTTLKYKGWITDMRGAFGSNSNFERVIEYYVDSPNNLLYYNNFPNLQNFPEAYQDNVKRGKCYYDKYHYCVNHFQEPDKSNKSELKFTLGYNKYWLVDIEGITLDIEAANPEEGGILYYINFKKETIHDNTLNTGWCNFNIAEEIDDDDNNYTGIAYANIGDVDINNANLAKNIIWQDKNDEYKGIWQNILRVNSESSYFKKTFSNKVNTLNTEDLYYFWIGELYRPSVPNKFGGTSEEALANNKWEVCGETQIIKPTDTNITVTATEGDTYYQRYDHLKTYPWSTDKTNSIVEIVSFGCETRINLDGRYDKFRGLKDNTIIDPTIFNQYNPIYSQRNNYFTGVYLNEDNNIFSSYPSGVVWSNPKSYGEEIDSFTNLIGANSMKLDSLYGPVNKLVTIGNDIYAFQDKGISRILYNNRVQVQASDGIPIELSSSGKVDGKFYISNTHGCKNKWSLINTPTGVYFIDDYTKSIMHFDGEKLTDLSYTKNMFNWVYKKANLNVWNPVDFANIRTYYDQYNNDIYFTNNDEALAFNEKLGQFSSFYNYGNVTGFINFDGSSYQIYEGKFYKLHGGTEYCKFFDKGPAQYSIEVIANPEFTTDKMFESIEFRTNDTFEKTAHRQRNNNSTSVPFSNHPFNTMIVSNEYQTAISGIDKLIKKFRTWRWEINRAKYGNEEIGWTKSRDRIRNPWAKIKLVGESNKLLKLYDTVVTYYN